MRTLLPIAVAGVVLAAGCASTPAPNAEMAVSVAAVAHATATGPDARQTLVRFARRWQHNTHLKTSIAW